MIRRVLYALSIAIVLSLGAATPAQALSLSLFSFASTTPKEEKPSAFVADPIATDSAVLDSTVVDAYFSANLDGLETDQATVPPLPLTVVKGVSSYFSSWHPGIDIRADKGSHIRAIRAGVVLENAYQPGGYGRYVVLEHESDGVRVRSLYAHMEESLVTVGEQVDVKDIIGYVGMTGHTTGPHVHFETRICPEGAEYYLCGAIDPIRYITKGLPGNLAKK